LLTFENEPDLYDFLGFSYIPPEIREDKGELELALKNKLPKLIELKDVRGDLHIHSSYDVKTSHDLGKSSFEELVLKAKSKNYIYIVFTDHNPRQSNIEDKEIFIILKARKEYIDQKIKPMGVSCFIGLEVDIKPNGELALPESAYEYVDYIIASGHSTFHQDSKQMTQQI
jgi:DNA polymerase (family 10)